MHRSFLHHRLGSSWMPQSLQMVNSLMVGLVQRLEKMVVEFLSYS